MSPFIKIVVAIQVLLLCTLFSQLWIGYGSVVHIWHLDEAIEKQQQANQVLNDRNAVLLAEVKALQNGLEALEERARIDLGMVKPNETFFQIID